MKDITERLAEVVKLMEADFPINDNAFASFDEAIDTIRQLRKERDEARRELCRIESASSGDPNMTRRAVAADLGWDCFKEDGN